MASKNKAPPAAPDISVVGDQLQIYPSGYTEASIPSRSHDTHDRNLVEHMSRFRESPLDFLREISLHIQGSGWRSYDNIIGQPVFYSGFSDSMKASVMQTPMLRAKIVELAAKRLTVEEDEGSLDTTSASYKGVRASRRVEIEGSLRDVAERMTDEMICKMESKRFIRGAYYLVTALTTRAYHQGIHVSSDEVLRLRDVAEKAARDRQSIIFLPCHRSHIDYISLQLICYRLGLALPTVIAGDNLNFPLLGPFLQHAGAMWIRRSFGDDSLYVTLVQSYIDNLLQRGFNIECFIEGGRSRMGKLLPPKYGILGFFIDSLLNGRVEDAIVCPVSTQYDKVIEVDSYISELLGQSKPKENLMDFLSASSILSLKLGRVDVRFHQPWSLRSFIRDQEVKFYSLSESEQADLSRSYNSNLRIRMLRTLGYKVLSDINAVSVVMPTSLIGTVLLTLRGRGVGKTELIRRVDWLCDRVRGQGGRVAHFGGLPTAIVVERGLEVLGPNLVTTQRDLAEETYYVVDRFQLSFYRNMLIHLFVSEALVSASLYTQIKAGSALESQAISYSSLQSQVSFLSQLFRGEFIFPTAGLSTNLAQTIAGLETDGIIKVARSPKPIDGVASSAIESVELSEPERARGRENFDFFCFLIWPFIEASWLGAVSLMMLAPPSEDVEEHKEELKWLDARQVHARAQFLGKTLFAQGDLSYFEAVNKETLKNAYQRFEEEGMVLSVKPKDNKAAPQMLRLAKEWMPQRDLDGGLRPEGRLWEFAEEISKSRLEGKNRRGGDTVVGRVLRLVETVGNSLWDEAFLDETNVGVDDSGRGLASAEEEQARREKRKRPPFRTRSNL